LWNFFARYTRTNFVSIYTVRSTCYPVLNLLLFQILICVFNATFNKLQFCRGGQFYLWWTTEYKEDTIELSQILLKFNMCGVPVMQYYIYSYLWVKFYLSQARTWISNIIYHGLFCIQWIKMRGECSLCWYWRNFRPSLF
jgi:hypothetical protein